MARSCTKGRSKPREPPPSHGPPHRAHHPHPRRLRGLRGHLEDPEHAAHPADVGDERHPRHRAARRDPADRQRPRLRQQADPGDRDRLRHDQRGRRLPRDRPHARDVQDAPAASGGRGEVTEVGAVDFNVIRCLYILAFALFIFGLRLVTHPRTARRGNLIAAIGMAIALVATLLIKQVGDYGLIALGIAVGTAVGIPAARNVKMTAMPQMVALFNGVGGGAVALIACAVAIAAGTESQALFILILVFAALLGNMFVLPIGGADMPVVISLLNAFTGLSAAAAGIALQNVALIVGGLIVGAPGSILTNLMAEAMNRSIANIFKGGFGGVTAAAGGGGEEKPVRSTDPSDVAIQLAYARKVVVAPGYGMAVAQAQHTVRELADELEKRGIEVDYAIH